MSIEQPHNPLHGVTLEMILNYLVDRHGWDKLGSMIDIRCFKNNPSIKSCLKFLRRTPWARDKVESLYLLSVLSYEKDQSRAGYCL
jgi:uncharacterized protein (DUF2132 family)